MRLYKKKCLDLRMNKSAKKIIAKNIDLRLKNKSIDKVLKRKKKKILKYSIK